VRSTKRPASAVPIDGTNLPAELIAVAFGER
jgi:hypothetical protein